MPKNVDFNEYRRAQRRRSADQKNRLDRGNLAANDHLFTPQVDISKGIARRQDQGDPGENPRLSAPMPSATEYQPTEISRGLKRDARRNAIKRRFG